MKRLTVVLCLALGACGESHYVPAYLSPADQALADCRGQANSSVAGGLVLGGNAFMAAAMAQQSVNDCMAAKGYRLAD